MAHVRDDFSTRILGTASCGTQDPALIGLRRGCMTIQLQSSLVILSCRCYSRHQNKLVWQKQSSSSMSSCSNMMTDYTNNLWRLPHSLAGAVSDLLYRKRPPVLVAPDSSRTPSFIQKQHSWKLLCMNPLFMVLSEQPFNDLLLEHARFPAGGSSLLLLVTSGTTP